jgi:hypothetical protein
VTVREATAASAGLIGGRGVRKGADREDLAETVGRGGTLDALPGERIEAEGQNTWSRRLHRSR